MFFSSQIAIRKNAAIMFIGFQFALSTAFALTLGTSTEALNYYGSQFQSDYQSGNLRDQALLQSLHQILAGGHVKRAGQPDELVSDCANSLTIRNQTSRCVQHQALGYDRARQQLFGYLHLEQSGGVYSVKDVYCEKNFTDRDFGGEKNIGPGLVPGNASILNTEHTWPQSRFTSRFSKEMQKSDLHHLFPTDSEMNSRRGNMRFGIVTKEVEDLKCPIAKLGHQASGEIVFEVPENHKGHVARALFYFATRYKMKVSPNEEAALRQWHRDHPVDELEAARNNMIEKVQGNRNPFIDFPDLIDKIQTFNSVIQ